MEDTVYDEAVKRLALRLGVTVDYINEVMDGYEEESKKIHQEIRDSRKNIASVKRIVVN